MNESTKGKKRGHKIDFLREYNNLNFGVTVNAKIAGHIQGIAAKNKITSSRVIRHILEDYFDHKR